MYKRGPFRFVCKLCQNLREPRAPHDQESQYFSLTQHFGIPYTLLGCSYPILACMAPWHNRNLKTTPSSNPVHADARKMLSGSQLILLSHVLTFNSIYSYLNASRVILQQLPLRNQKILLYKRVSTYP